MAQNLELIEYLDAAGIWGSLFILLVIVLAFRLWHKPAVEGLDRYDGMEGEAITDISPRGQVRLSGEIWRARSRSGVIKKGSFIRVIGKKGLTLIVEKTKTEQED